MANRDHSLDDGIIQAAYSEFLAYGFQKASLHKIAEKAGVTTGQSTQDTRIKTRCLPVCFRIFLRRCRFSLLPSRKNTKKQSAARSRMISSAP